MPLRKDKRKKAAKRLQVRQNFYLESVALFRQQMIGATLFLKLRFEFHL